MVAIGTVTLNPAVALQVKVRGNVRGTVEGRYEITEQIGQGGFAVVMEGEG